MEWRRLLKFKCPGCKAMLQKKELNYVCSGKCGFSINTLRFDFLVKRMQQPRQPQQDPEENLSALNNL